MITVKTDKGNQDMFFNYLYVHTPTIENPLLSKTGLSSNGLQVDVNPHTLQSLQFENILSIGEGANLPIESSFFASIY